ncbi:hypothetical protein NHX12_002396 [Muraenolepis orangiensis]|uniref:Carbohydrate kinase PfkB domain-containing protein n=1 Tax=Muraenolepis orangiensis TaxID=630683 RepID=A0A9Q0DWQ2_9TELE|nr:hypothetical protein NHX12_002396 [Muraenolepis orangiensis]
MGRSRAYGNAPFRVHPSVSQALADHQPVVALESTIITHGMPYPHNLRTALEVEALVRAQGATPATVGVIRGQVHVGLSSDQLEYLARSEGSLKISRRDLPYAISQGLSGGTTVSGTMIAAHRAGIPIFVTGGIGGVHRGGEHSLDVSADLTELGRTPVAVVSAGVKSILDIGRTLEFLETQGVCVATYGPTNNFPAFFSPQSGFTSPYHVRDPSEAAKLIEGTLCLGLQSGLLIAVPICEEHAAVGQQIDDAIRTAVAEARLAAQRTATYCAVITESGELSLGLGDMDIHQQITEQYVSSFEEQLSTASLVCLDGNLPVSTIDYVCARAKELAVSVWYEPTDSDKACKPFLSESWKLLAYSSPNLAELCAMNTTLDVLTCALALARPLLEHLHCLVVTLGSDGVLVCGMHDGDGSVRLQPRAEGKTRGRLCALHYAALPVTREIVNVSGAGDSLAGGILAGVLQGQDTDSCVRMGLLAARLSLATQHPVDPLLCMEAVDPGQTLSRPWPRPRLLWID